jgi:ABC-type multidrug transport system permease subunit
MTDTKDSAAESSEAHSCRGTFSMNARKKIRLIFTIALRDITQIRGSGLPVLLTLSALLLSLIGIPFFIYANADAGFGGALHLDGAWTASGIGGVIVEPIILTLLHLVYAYSMVVTMILVPVAFSIAYDQEIKKGTVRTLTCYPVGVFEITTAKLTYAAIMGLVFGVPVFLLPILGLGKPIGDLFAVFLVPYFMSLLIVAVGAFVANSLTFATKKMYIRPTVLANLLVVFSFFTTSTVLSLLSYLLSYASPFFQAVGKLTPLSLFHQGRLLLTYVFGGSESPVWLVFLLPIALLVLGAWLSLRLWPDIYERE